jgi:tetratricopeptide (TPR) repeat protein
MFVVVKTNVEVRLALLEWMQRTGELGILEVLEPEMKRYWGPNKEYGPYNAQADGWPNAGEVIRDYRKRVKHISTAEFARLYSEALGESPPVTERWIQRMEKENLVPAELPRRRIIAGILGVPPVLLGLGILADLQAKPHQHTSGVNKAIDIASYARTLDLYWRIDHTSTAQHFLAEIEAIIAQMRAEAKVSSPQTQKQLFELLCGYYNLASIIYDDQLKYDKAYAYAHDAVVLSSNIQNNKLLAMSLYQRGFIRQVQAEQGTSTFMPYLQEALNDYNAAIPISTPKVEAALQMDLALVYALMKRSAAADNALTRAGALLDRGGLDEGTFIDHFADSNQGRYRLGQAVVFTTLKRFDDASDLIYEAKEGINPTQTRRLAWADIVEAQIYFGQRNYPLAASTSLQALKVAKALNSQYNIRLIQHLYSELLKTKYANAQPVRELGSTLILP